MCGEYINNAGGDIEKLRDDILDLFDKLKEGDIDENVRYSRYKLLKVAIMQIKENTETKEKLQAFFKTLPSSIPPELGTAEETMTKPASPSVEMLDTLTQETIFGRLLESTFYTLYCQFMFLQLLP